MFQNPTSSKEQQLAREFLRDSPTVRLFEMRIGPSVPSSCRLFLAENMV